MISKYFNPAYWFLFDDDPVTGEDRTVTPGVVEAGQEVFRTIVGFAVVGVVLYVVALIVGLLN